MLPDSVAVFLFPETKRKTVGGAAVSLGVVFLVALAGVLES